MQASGLLTGEDCIVHQASGFNVVSALGTNDALHISKRCVKKEFG
ncbi:hypothetical protein [Synechococcus sp. MIT S9504]|nr:hypothetical protein [Synechococcus sp. MIT S9504]